MDKLHDFYENEDANEDVIKLEMEMSDGGIPSSSQFYDLLFGSLSVPAYSMFASGDGHAQYDMCDVIALTQCSFCGSLELAMYNFRICKACNEVQYCSSECQKLHWFLHHKNHCCRSKNIHLCPFLSPEFCKIERNKTIEQ